MPPYTITPPYPSFSLVISEAYIHVRAPEPRADLPLPSRFHPYTRPAPRERYLDECMVRCRVFFFASITKRLTRRALTSRLPLITATHHRLSQPSPSVLCVYIILLALQ